MPLIEDDEMIALQIPDLVEAAEAMGLKVRRFPFHDGGIPKNMQEALDFIAELIARYEAGERMVMHCRGGLGRAGSMAACLRLALGLSENTEEAIANAAAYADPKKFDPAQTARTMRNWLAAGPKDVGNQSRMAIQLMNETSDPKVLAELTHHGGDVDRALTAALGAVDGGDADTNGAIAGALLGARHGLHKIPKRWRLAILRQDEVDEAYGWIEAAARPL